MSAGDSFLEIINCVCHSSGSSKFLRNIHKKNVWKLYYITFKSDKSTQNLNYVMYTVGTTEIGISGAPSPLFFAYTPGPWLVRFFRSGKNPHEPNPQHLSH